MRAGEKAGPFTSIFVSLFVDRVRAGRRSVIVVWNGMIRGRMVARSAAAMAPSPPMQREAIRRSVIAVGTIGTIGAVLPMRTIAALPVLRRLMLRLTAGDERGQPFDVAVRPRLLSRLKVLRLVILLLVVVLLARIIRLRLARCERLAADMRLFVVAVVETVVGAAHLAGLLLLVIGLALAELFLRGGDQTEIMLGMLIVILRGDRIPGALCVARQL